MRSLVVGNVGVRLTPQLSSRTLGKFTFPIKQGVITAISLILVGQTASHLQLIVFQEELDKQYCV